MAAAYTWKAQGVDVITFDIDETLGVEDESTFIFRPSLRPLLSRLKEMGFRIGLLSSREGADIVGDCRRPQLLNFQCFAFALICSC